MKGRHAVIFRDHVRPVEDVLVMHYVLASGLQLALQLHPDLDHFQRIREYPRTYRRQSADCELHNILKIETAREMYIITAMRRAEAPELI